MIWKGSKTSMKWHICPPEYENMFDIYPQTLNINDIFTNQNNGIDIFTNHGFNQPRGKNYTPQWEPMGN